MNQASQAMEINSNKRRRLFPVESPLTRDLPEGVLEQVTQYLSNPTRLLLAVALTPNAAPLPSARTRTVMSTTPKWHNTKKSKQGADDLSVCDAQGNWTRLDFADFTKEVASKLTDEHVQRILELIHARDQLATLHLTGCLSLVGHGLKVLNGSTALKHFDMSLVMHDSASISPAPPISEDVILPILASIVTMERSSVELLCFPKKWRMEKSPAFQFFIERYSNYLENRSIHCNCGTESFNCRRLCHDEAVKTPRAWVIQNPLDFPHVTHDLIMKKYGLQRFTCHKCFDLTCYDCVVGSCDSCYYIPRHCVRCEKDYCRDCCIGNYSCSMCEDFLCKGCEETGASMIEFGDPKFPEHVCYSCFKLWSLALVNTKINWLIGWSSFGQSLDSIVS
jgi:hypothetical protein